jgi:poly-gamma-glutamate capsule biosynthesis protein CapA/YwtB (metallophosphatase superfamily)
MHYHSVSMIAVGDLAPSRPITATNPEVDKVWQMFREANLVMANLELPLTRSEARADKAITLKCDPSVTNSISECGVDVVTVANNHALDFGREGLFDTIEALAEHGIKAVGGGDSVQSAMRPVICNVDGVRVAIMGMASTLPTSYAAGEKRAGIAPIRVRTRFYIDSITLDEQPGISPWIETTVDAGDQLRACREIEAAKKNADVLVIQLHWGVPNGWCAAFQGPLAEYQRPLGHALIDAGADLIVGSHPHIVHGVERYKDGAILYSAGNFLFHSMATHSDMKLQEPYPPYKLESLEQGDARDGLIVRINISESKIQQLEFYPIRMNLEGDPQLLLDLEASNVLRRMQKLSSELGTDVAIAGDYAVLNWDQGVR